MNTYISVHFNTSAEKADMIAAILLDAGFEGVEVKENETVASIKKELLDETWLKELMESQGVAYSSEIIEQQNWNAAWESSFEPVVVGNFAAIRASFHQPDINVLHDIIITPKMSFGTGHHATTHLMIEQMASLDLTGKQVIDFGTGTAVLAILAEKLGASHILATDNDEWSISNSIENIAANNCKNIQPLLAHGFPEGKQADIILANINLNVIIESLSAIKDALGPRGQALFSGLLYTDKDIISRQLADHGFSIDNLQERNGWICLLTSATDYPQD